MQPLCRAQSIDPELIRTNMEAVVNSQENADDFQAGFIFGVTILVTVWGLAFLKVITAHKETE